MHRAEVWGTARRIGFRLQLWWRLIVVFAGRFLGDAIGWSIVQQGRLKGLRHGEGEGMVGLIGSKKDHLDLEARILLDAKIQQLGDELREAFGHRWLSIESADGSKFACLRSGGKVDVEQGNDGSKSRCPGRAGVPISPPVATKQKRKAITTASRFKSENRMVCLFFAKYLLGRNFAPHLKAATAPS
jgi:hypothetical protein